MGLGHEKLDVYRLSIGYVAWVYGNDLDSDPDSDSDLERKTSQPEGAGDSQ
jgi:hypothetical protein